MKICPHTGISEIATLFPVLDTNRLQSILLQTRCWLEHQVIGLNLCPFAKAVYIKNKIIYQVTGAHTESQLKDELLHLLIFLQKTDPAFVDTVLLIHPDVLQDFTTYCLFTQNLDVLLKRQKMRGIFQVATFHPDYVFYGVEADDIQNFTNRSPYPILHILREDSIEKALENYSDPQQIYKKNIDTLNRLGPEKIKMLQSYDKLK